jgi:hypothetical protein
VTPEEFKKIPLGHFISAHVLFGWCANCAGHDVVEEVFAWRVWAGNNVPEVDRALSRNFGEGE